MNVKSLEAGDGLFPLHSCFLFSFCLAVREVQRNAYHRINNKNSNVATVVSLCCDILKYLSASTKTNTASQPTQQYFKALNPKHAKNQCAIKKPLQPAPCCVMCPATILHMILTKTNDLEAFVELFVHMAAAWGWPDDKWAP